MKAREQANVHRPALGDQELRRILSIQEKRVVRNDGTIRHETKLYQILNAAKSLKKVVVQERIDGKIYLVHEARDLAYRELHEPLKQNAEVKLNKKKSFPPKAVIPPVSHPWKGAGFEQRQTKRQAALAA